ncbi:MAG: hypothetical protein ACE14V_15035 [bacterium]
MVLVDEVAVSFPRPKPPKAAIIFFHLAKDYEKCTVSKQNNSLPNGKELFSCMLAIPKSNRTNSDNKYTLNPE